MLEKYEKYLDLIESHLLRKYFENQKDYLHCKEGCSHCCETGEYPFSRLEFEYAMLGYNALNEEEKNIIQKKADKIKLDKKNSTEKVCMHECPFLTDKKCSIYKHRGIICRTHGLLFFIEDKDGNSRNKIPHCVNLGLNYSNVYDENIGMISDELWGKSGIKNEPVAYNIGLKALCSNSVTKELELDFGEAEALIEWFVD